MHNQIYKKRFESFIDHKHGIANSFSRAALNYDRYATFQRNCGDHLCAFLGHVKGQKLLDAGCGTGWFSRRWQSWGKKVIALDLSTAMLDQANQKQSASMYILGDIEQLPLSTGSIDIIFSNLVLQWCNSLPQALSELYRVLKPGGILALSTLALGSLVELEQAWRKIDSNTHINGFLSETTIVKAFAPYRHRVLVELHHLYYTCLIDLLREIKGVGAGYLHNGRLPGLTSRSRLKALEDSWLLCPAGFQLSYRVVYGVLYRD